MLRSLSAVSLSCLLCFSVAATSDPLKQREDREPEAKTGYTDKKAFLADDYMVVAANPYASWAGKNIIERGGSAIDAAVAVQAMLTLVEPQSSGIGGGAFILYWDNEKKVLHTYDGRETAPAKANAYLFTEKGKPMKWRDAVVGGKSVGVPGVLKALDQAHSEFGKLDWSILFDDTIATAEKGFNVSPRLNRLLGLNIHPGLSTFPASKAYFYPGGEPLAIDSKKKNLALAKTLKNIATQGAEYFYSGALPEAIAKAAQQATINPGLITAEDFANYEVVKRTPVCGAYREKRVCGMAPPSSGGINVLQILKMLEPFDIGAMTPDSTQFIHLYAQASAMSYADRSLYIADSDFTNLPFGALINDAYLQSRGSGISADGDMKRFKPGKPYVGSQFGVDTALELPNTSHISIVDKQGNAISMTSSIEFMFGSGIMVDGFLLNNQLTDFSLSPTQNGHPALNRVEPNKRPRSAMSPTIVFNDQNEVELVIGSPGGSRIISYVAQTIIGVVDWGLNVQEAINLPKVTNRNDYTALEKDTPVAKRENELKALGHNVRVIDLNSGLHGIQVSQDQLIGGADPRREGIAVGQ